MRLLILMTFVSAILMGCASTDVEMRTLDSTKWEVAQISGMIIFTTETTKLPTLDFDAEKMTVNGTTGCNNYSGSYTMDGSQLAFGPMATTRMACPDIAIESGFQKAIAKIGSYKINGDLLRFFDDSGVELLKAQPATAE